jgi:predicted enzyme related to lactoylglutathione lyase
VLSQGMNKQLQVHPATHRYLEQRSITVHVAGTREAVKTCNELAEGVPVAGLFHSTCCPFPACHRPACGQRLKSTSSRDAVQRGAHTRDMPVRLHHIVIDAHDLPGLARFWTQALGWRILSERENEIVVGTDENAPVGICFMPVTGPKTVKNRVHIDLTSSAADRDQEIDRLLALGARRVDIGQTGAESWTVLVDPEGNEFCVVRPKETLIR